MLCLEKGYLQIWEDEDDCKTKDFTLMLIMVYCVCLKFEGVFET